MADTSSLLRNRTRKCTEGSNPSLSAISCYRKESRLMLQSAKEMKVINVRL